MARPEFYAELRLRREKLVKELESIDLLLSESDGEANGVTHNPNTEAKASTSKKGKTEAQGEPKGSLSWEEYIVYIIRKFYNGRATSKQVTEYAILANPNIPSDRIADAVRGNISRMATSEEERRLNVEKTRNRKLGYFYTVNEMGVAA